MKYYPMFLNINNYPTLVIGGGKVAYRKVLQLISAGASVTLVSKSIIPEFETLKKEINLKIRQIESSDVDEKYRLVIIATNDSIINNKVASICKEKSILFNRADSDDDNDFITGATINKGPVSIAITSGVPTLSKLIKELVSQSISNEMILLTELLAEVRKKFKGTAEGNRIMKEYSTFATLNRIKVEGFEKIKKEVLSCLSC